MTEEFDFGDLGQDEPVDYARLAALQSLAGADNLDSAAGPAVERPVTDRDVDALFAAQEAKRAEQELATKQFERDLARARGESKNPLDVMEAVGIERLAHEMATSPDLIASFNEIRQMAAEMRERGQAVPTGILAAEPEFAPEPDSILGYMDRVSFNALTQTVLGHRQPNDVPAGWSALDWHQLLKSKGAIR